MHQHSKTTTRKISQRTFLRESSSWRFRFLYRWAMRRYPGLPAVYGLYGSVFPIILFALFSTSPQFIFGVGCCSGGACRSSSAWHGNRGRKQRGHDGCTGVYIFVALWLLAFYFMNAGKLVNYISAPVMGGLSQAYVLQSY